MGDAPGDGVLDVVTTARQIHDRERSAREVVAASLAAIERGNEELNAFVHVDGDAALAAADAVDAAIAAGDPVGPLAGVPFGVKDLEDCAGMPTTMGSRWFVDGPPATIDDLHVERLRGAGAIPLGKTATPEFGTWGYTASPVLGVTRNPWDPSRTPGGSSGGSAAAVSAGFVPFATASDGGGSIRGPAGSTGLVGLRCCYGRIPTYGSTHLAQNAVVGVVTTNVADHALLLDVLAGPDARDRTCLPAGGVSYRTVIDELDVAGLRAVFTTDFGFAVVDPEYAAVAARAAALLVGAADLRTADVDVRFADYTSIYTRIEGVDKYVGYDESLWTERIDELDPLTRDGWVRTAQVTLPKLARVEAARRQLELRVAELFADVDIVLSPTSACPPFAAEGPMPTEIAGQQVHGGMASVPQFFASLVNLPAVSIPAVTTAAGLPVGLQVIAPRFREDLCLRLARIAEQANPWPTRAPGW